MGRETDLIGQDLMTSSWRSEKNRMYNQHYLLFISVRGSRLIPNQSDFVYLNQRFLACFPTYQRSMRRVDLNKAMFWHAEASHFGGSLGKPIEEEHINLKSIIALEVHNNSNQLVKGGESYTTSVEKKHMVSLIFCTSISKHSNRHEIMETASVYLITFYCKYPLIKKK